MYKKYGKEKGDIILNPKYDDGYRRYNLSMKEIIKSINKCNYPIDGKNIMVDDNGEMISILEYIKRYGGSSGGGGGEKPNPSKQYRLEVSSSNGTFITRPDFKSILSVTLYEDNKEVTDKIKAKYFKWSRISGASTSDQKLDAEWNLRWSQGAKSIPITRNDVRRSATFHVSFVTEEEKEVEWVVDAYNSYIKTMKMEDNKNGK